MNAIRHASLPGLSSKLLQGNAVGIIIHQRHFAPFEETRFGEDDTFYLAELHLTGPKAILGKRDALGRNHLRLGRRRLGVQRNDRKDEGQDVDESFHGSK